MKKFYTCKYDKPFKEIMLNEKNKDILKKLLETILKQEIKYINIKNVELSVKGMDVKRKSVDVYLESLNKKIEIEVNTSLESYIHPRNMSYISNIYSSHTLRNDSYDEKTDIIQINLNYNQKNKRIYNEYMMRDLYGDVYVKNLKIIELNMEKYKEMWYHGSEKEKEENKFLIMLDLNEEELKKIKGDKVVSKYMKEINKLNNDSEFVEYMSAEEDARKIYNSRMYDAREKGFKQGYDEGIEQGIEKGIEKNKIEIAKNLLDNNVDINVISLSTGLSQEEIKKLSR